MLLTFDSPMASMSVDMDPILAGILVSLLAVVLLTRYFAQIREAGHE